LKSFLTNLFFGITLNKDKLTIWTFFFAKSYPNGYNENQDIELSEFIRSKYNLSLSWVDEFTKYYDAVLDEEDGYVENPRKLSVSLKNGNLLEIEFHPGDTVFYLNKENIGCTGPHYYIHKISLAKLKELVLDTDLTEEKFFLLLPMVFVDGNEIEEMISIISQYLVKLPFKAEDHEIITKCIINDIKK